MTLFVICASLLVLLCLAWLLFGLFNNKAESLDQEAVNVTLARERSDILSAALADGSIDQATYDYEREQLDYDLAADLTLENNSGTKRGGHTVAAVLVTLFVPVAAGGLYLKLGNLDAITADKTQPLANSSSANSQTNAGQGQLPGPLAELLPQLEERLANDPSDVQGWRLLGRSYLSIREYGRAETALEKALALDENDIDTITQLAESKAMSRDGDLSGEPMVLLDRAIALNPQHEHTLWLRSIGLQQAGNHQEALRGFNLLMGLNQDNPDALATVDQMRSQSIQALAADSVRQASEETAAGPAVEITVELDASAAEDVLAEHAVFIYATASNGPPMPLAVTKLSVSDLPATVVLDDSMAMIPTMKLSSFNEVTIGARVSASGNPIAQTGDWFSEVANVIISEQPTLTLTIDQQTP